MQQRNKSMNHLWQEGFAEDETMNEQSKMFVCNDVRLACTSYILEADVKRRAYRFFIVQRKSLNQLLFAQRGAASSQTFAL